ncbi:hypothetical protein SO802_034343 [Lithocarpus litseifolius]|uniref:Reverse transcriptase n=1 Tax=Lithocarpus litseifolius TaxID=425828 RepID=A0AAW2BGX3_9ROSI
MPLPGPIGTRTLQGIFGNLETRKEYWTLKSRLNWAAFRDRNTSFSHTSTLVRRHRNRIRSIKNSQGEWITDEGEVKNFILEVTEEEIKQGLWALKPFKAPSLDGLHVEFFQIFWPDVKDLVIKEVSDIFESKVIPDYLNETLIALVPKNQRPESLNSYRSISLCNSIYKVVTKIIVGRLRPCLYQLI